MADLAVWPTDGAGPGGDGSVSSEARWRKMARSWANTGVDGALLALGGGLGSLQPTLVAGPACQVAVGSCWIDGHYCELTAPATIPIATAGIVVVRFTPADNHAELLYRDGVTVPTQTVASYELVIAQISGGSVIDKRIMAVGGEAAVASNADVTVSAINPTYGAVPGTTLPLWAVGLYEIKFQADVDVTALAAGNLIYLAPGFSGTYNGVPGGGPWTFPIPAATPRVFWDMNAVRRDCRLHGTFPVAVIRPAEAVLTLGACKGSATGTVIVRQTTGGTWLHVRRIG